MNKLLFTMTLALMSSSVMAAFNGPSAPAVSNVEQAKSAADDSFVVLTGHIVQSLGGDLYLFKDASGEIEVEIDHENWMGQEVSPQDTVTIRGEVDSEWTTTQIDVDMIQKI
ncbi:NirD/YgiW/YdeI family stress tolerance protein [Vibrio gigantis]|uniref:NirD/YgiW/YdeI family stress tolerance protein n=1 Tax=Vibrio gigantis TaxID=296199 RepID=UPI001BFDD91F|nr:NirD/YgiW/YdeI family stress tolerance protein [Vibrio gigantis]